MTATALAFTAGVLLLQQQAALPAVGWLALLPACAALGAWRRALAIPAALAIGFLWAAGAAQLRLALVCAGGFVAATIVFVLGIALLPALDETFVAGVPVSWLLLGLGVYPLAISVAALYVRAAQRNEARYRSLAEPA